MKTKLKFIPITLLLAAQTLNAQTVISAQQVYCYEQSSALINPVVAKAVLTQQATLGTYLSSYNNSWTASGGFNMNYSPPAGNTLVKASFGGIGSSDANVGYSFNFGLDYDLTNVNAQVGLTLTIHDDKGLINGGLDTVVTDSWSFLGNTTATAPGTINFGYATTGSVSVSSIIPDQIWTSVSDLIAMEGGTFGDYISYDLALTTSAIDTVTGQDLLASGDAGIIRRDGGFQYGKSYTFVADGKTQICPEPSSVLLCGLASITLLARRRK